MPKNEVTSIEKEIKGSLLNTDSLDINKKLPFHLAVASSADDRETSSSRTQSLDVDCLLSNAEHPACLKSGACYDRPFELDPGSRWVKRLRPSASDSFAYGTKSSKIGEASSHEKVNKLFSRILKGSKTGSEPKMSNSHSKDHMATDETAPSMGNIDSSSNESVRNSQDVTLSHAWIQRWCHKSAGSREKNSKAILLCEPECSKEILDDFQKKQFPSIHAMALMGKAMTSFRPCAFRKRGTFVVWN